MPKVARTYRLDAGLVERLEARAGELGQSYTVFVTRALEKALAGDVGARSGKVTDPSPVGSAEPVRSAASPRAPVAPGGLLHCPVAGCDFAASSPNAICNSHGKKVR